MNVEGILDDNNSNINENSTSAFLEYARSFDAGTRSECAMSICLPTITRMAGIWTSKAGHTTTYSHPYP